MHETHLLAHVVRLVEEHLAGSPRARPTVVRIRVSPWSHVAEHDSKALNAAWGLVASGTLAQGTILEVSLAAVPHACHRCGHGGAGEAPALSCPRCGSLVLPAMDLPDVLLQEIEVEE